MKLTYNWLKDFVAIALPAQKLAHALTMAGLEVVSLEQRDGDWVFEIEITSNRPDWLSVCGIAREVAAITGAKLLLPRASPVIQTFSKQPLSVKVENTKDCPYYSARIIRGVTVGPSPQWLARRLELIGCRSINNVVDATNYILFSWGEPLHAFDAGTLPSPSILVRRARSGETMMTIDGQKRILTGDMLAIACGKSAAESRAIALAGIMGGKDSEVTAQTTDILLEAAVFDPVLIRRSKRALGMQTDSAYRFERGVDPQTAASAAVKAEKLIIELAGGACVAHQKVQGASPLKRHIRLRPSSVNELLGASIPARAIKAYLAPLGFTLRKGRKDIFIVQVPSFRQDAVSAIDLVEEVARIHGFAHIPTTIPQIKPHVEKPGGRELVRQARDILIGLGLQEVITYSLVDQELLRVFGKDAEYAPLEIRNPLSKEQGALRSTLIPSLGRVVAFNLNQKQEHIGIFEIAHVYLPSAGEPREILALGIALCGNRTFFLEQGGVREEVSLLHLKGIAEKLFERLRVQDYAWKAHGGQEIRIFVRQEDVGHMGGLSAPQRDLLGIKNNQVYVLEIILEKAFDAVSARTQFAPLPKYPGINRDISFVVQETTPVQDIAARLQRLGAPLLRQVRIIDYYRGKQIPEGLRGVTLSCQYRSDEKTLAEEEIMSLHEAACGCLVKEFGAKLREGK